MITLSLAAHNASNLSKRAADFICKGTDDSEMMSDAFNALPADGGCIVLSEGEFLLTEPITYPNKPLMIRGQGIPSSSPYIQATKLEFTFSSVDDCIVFYNLAIGQSLENVHIIGDDANTRYGIILVNGAAYNSIRFVTNTNVTDAGVRGDSGNSQNVFERVITHELAKGFWMYGNNNTYIVCQAMRATANPGGDWGFAVQETMAMYIACFAINYAVGFVVTNYAEYIQLLGCSTESCDVGLIVSGTPEPRGSYVAGLGCVTSQHATFGAIRIFGSIGTQLEGLRVRNSVSGLSVEIGPTANTLIINGGVLEDATPFTSDPAAVARIQNVSHQQQWLDWST